MENRHGLVTDVGVLQANATAERDAALVMIERIPGDHSVTVGAAKNYDTKDLVAAARQMNAPPHVAPSRAGVSRVMVTLAAAYNMVRIRNLPTANEGAKHEE
jgi:hypothetical protein